VKFLIAFNHSRIVKRTLRRFISRLTHKARLTQHRTTEKSFIKPRVIALPAPKKSQQQRFVDAIYARQVGLVQQEQRRHREVDLAREGDRAEPVFEQEVHEIALQHDREDAEEEKVENFLHFYLVAHARQVAVEGHSEAHLDEGDVEREETAVEVIGGVLGHKDGNADQVEHGEKWHDILVVISCDGNSTAQREKMRT